MNTFQGKTALFESYWLLKKQRRPQKNFKLTWIYLGLEWGWKIDILTTKDRSNSALWIIHETLDPITYYVSYFTSHNQWKHQHHLRCDKGSLYSLIGLVLSLSDSRFPDMPMLTKHRRRRVLLFSIGSSFYWNGLTESKLPRNLFQVKIRTRFSFGALVDREWIVIRTKIIQSGFNLDGARSSTRLDLVRFWFKILLLIEFSSGSYKIQPGWRSSSI